MSKEWIFPEEKLDDAQLRELCTALDIPALVAKVLVHRGYRDVESVSRFINKTGAVYHSPNLMTDMDKAAEGIRRAIDCGEKITVYGDYDVDGITATALMVRVLRELGAEVDAYIPDRRSEGYGVNKAALSRLAQNGTKLVVTVDTGITAVEETLHARELGLKVIITDHHECKSDIPEAEAVVNPKRPGCPYPFKELAGVGVAFKLICALCGDTKSVMEKYGDIVALGTIADVVSLTDENRAIADYGINKMQTDPNPGLRAVLEVVGSSSKWNSCAVVSYSVAPRLNAAGRMSSAMTAVELLLCEDAARAAELALLLDEENRRRQAEESLIFEQAVDMIYKNDMFNKKALVLAKRGWHHGIIGVVASRICDRFNRSCVLISVEDGLCKSSGRSVDGVNLFDALSSCGDILEKFGGHAYAAGFSIKEENIPELDRRLNEFAAASAGSTAARVYIDAVAEADELTLETVRRTEVLCPYGAGNKTPVFGVCGLTLSEVRTLSGGKHCRLRAEKGDARIEMIAFGMGAIADEFSPGDIVDAAGELNINIYNGIERVQLVLTDIRRSYRRISDELPSREDFADIYRMIKSLPQPIFSEVGRLSSEISRRSRRRIGTEKLINALIVFDDVGIISLGRLGDTVKIELAPGMEGKKFNLAESREYIRIKAELEQLEKGGIGHEN
ncbi:MAG: single-stranded-DNA-specific exonuclease RecJ [Oscillospiraceae bacterium]|nr:single-stranded-DNA-specific exonuclease RecJ [Oscillospiraceae bacterium]